MRRGFPHRIYVMDGGQTTPATLGGDEYDNRCVDVWLGRRRHLHVILQPKIKTVPLPGMAMHDAG